MEDVHGRCVDVVVMMLYTGGWGGGGGGELLGLFGAGVPMRCVPSKSSLHACSSS